MQQTATTVADGWVFVGRTDGLTDATRGCQAAQAAEALRRVRAAFGRHGVDPGAIRLRCLVPHSAGWDKALPAQLSPSYVAAGLLPRDVLIQIEGRAPLAG